MSLTFAVIAGCVDLPDSDLAATDIVTDDIMVKLNQNAKFAAVRSEVFFMGYYKHGDQVPKPISPVDGYQYVQSELVFDWLLVATRAPLPSFVSGQATAPVLSSSQVANLYWPEADIDDSTGKVSITVSYYKQGGAETITHDGVVKVYVHAQRASVNFPT